MILIQHHIHLHLSQYLWYLFHGIRRCISIYICCACVYINPRLTWAFIGSPFISKEVGNHLAYTPLDRSWYVPSTTWQQSLSFMKTISTDESKQRRRSTFTTHGCRLIIFPCVIGSWIEYLKLRWSFTYQSHLNTEGSTQLRLSLLSCEHHSL